MPEHNRYIKAARAKFAGDEDVEVLDISGDDAIGGVWINARIFVHDDELELVPGPTYEVWIAEQEYLRAAPGGSFVGAWVWAFDQHFTCDDDPDGKGARLSAHRYARYLRETFPCSFVGVFPAGKHPLPIKHSH